MMAVIRVFQLRAQPWWDPFGMVRRWVIYSTKRGEFFNNRHCKWSSSPDYGGVSEGFFFATAFVAWDLVGNLDLEADYDE